MSTNGETGELSTAPVAAQGSDLFPITFCPICGYDLRDRAGFGTCPECGFEYDGGMMMIPCVSRRRLALVEVMVLVLAVPFVAPCCFLPFAMPRSWQLGLVIFLALGFVLWRWWRAQRPRHAAAHLYVDDVGYALVRRAGPLKRQAWRAYRIKLTGSFFHWRVSDEQRGVWRLTISPPFVTGGLRDGISVKIRATYDEAKRLLRDLQARVRAHT